MRTALGLSAAVVALSLSSSAFAQSSTPPAPVMPVPVYKDWMPGATPINGSSASASGSVSDPSSPPPQADKPAEGATHEEEGDDRWHVSLDAVFGFGATPVVNQRLIGPLITQESRTLGTARFATQSLNLGLSYEVVRDLRIGILLPLGTGSLYPADTRGGAIVGNLVIGGEYELHLRKGLDGYGGLDVALPTASGEELPTSEELASGSHVNQNEHDRFSLAKAMSDSRGREDTAAFAPKHLGLVPKIGAIWKARERVEIEPYLKYESLHATGTNSSYEGAFVIAARGTYRFHERVDATLRIWTNIPTAGADTAVAVAEPQLRGHFGGFMPILGVVLPVAGELTNPYVIGVRATVAARF